MDLIPLQQASIERGFGAASILPTDSSPKAKLLLRDKFRQKRISALTELAVGKSWSRLLIGQRHAQLSLLPRVKGVACFRVITGHDYLQAHLTCWPG
ncbi:hypothetical protein TNCV_2372981 [Trichonephila clavipes]|nr:hypothetical protein TNCV_2372981 [Trichonephila clavipes]